METKKMTLAEAKEFVKNTKYIVWNEDESRQLQEKLFEIGCRWIHSGNEICHTEHPFITIDECLNILYIGKRDYKYFEEEKKRFEETYKILNIEIERESKKEPKPKFDPNTLQVFDKVLVRDNQHNAWKAKFYHFRDKDWFYTIDSVYFRYCIPYNDETKHLLRTNDDAPEFYQLD